MTFPVAGRTASVTAKDGVVRRTHTCTLADPKAIVVGTQGFGEHGARYGGLAATLSKAGYALCAYALILQAARPRPFQGRRSRL